VNLSALPRIFILADERGSGQWKQSEEGRGGRNAHDLPKPRGIAGDEQRDVGPYVVRELEPLLGRLDHEEFGAVGHGVLNAERDDLELDGSGLELGVVEQRVDDFEEKLATLLGSEDELSLLLVLRRERRGGSAAEGTRGGENRDRRDPFR
jgi:hypothetical protein